MHAARILEHYPDADLRQLGDSLALVLERPLDMQTHWKAQDNFPQWVEGMPDLQGRDFEMSEFYSLVANHYPGASFGQVNTLNDAVQVLTYIDFGGDAETWIARFDASISSIHAEAPNFRSLTLGGSEHCMLDRDLFYTYAVEGIRLRDWVADYAAGLDVPSLRCSECDEPELVE